MKNIIRRLRHFSLFDGIIIILVICGILAFAYTFFRKATYITVTLKVGANNVVWNGGSSSDWFSYTLKKGMTQKDGFGRITAEVLTARNYQIDDQRSTEYITVKLKTVYSRATNQYTFQGKPVLLGSSINLYLGQLAVDGLITRMDGVKDYRVKKVITVEVQLREENPVFPENSGVRQHIADAITEGQEIKDSQGETVIKILKKTVEDAKKIVTTSGGDVLLQRDPLKKDLYLILEIQAVELNDRYYVFDDIPILVGYSIPLSTQTYSVLPEVTKFLSPL